MYGEEILKVAFDHNSKEFFSLGWQTKTDSTTSIYAQYFSPDGFPIGRQHKIVSMPYNMMTDFDIAVDKDGNSIVVWSQLEKPRSYLVYYQIFNTQGIPLEGPRMLSTASKGYVKISINTQGQFLISWFTGTAIHSQFFDKEKTREGDPVQHWYVGGLSPHTFPVEITENSYMAVASFRHDFSAAPDGGVTLINKSGTVMNYEADGVTSCCMAAFDMDYGEMITVGSFSLDSFSEGYADGTYISFFSNFNTSQTNFSIDEEPSRLIKVSQNKQGKIFAGSKSKSGKIKIYYLQNSGQQLFEPVELWNDTIDKSIASIDVKLNDDDHGSIIYAVNGTKGSHVFLQKTQFVSRDETQETIANDSYRQEGVFTRTLSTNNNHVVIWTSKGKDGSAVFARIYDSMFDKYLEVNLTGFMKDIDIVDMEAAIDSLGNFMVIWQIKNDSNIYAKKFNIKGEVLKEKFAVNEVLIFGAPRRNVYPKISANQRGDFIIIWYHGNSNLNARLIKEDGFDSGEKDIEGCCYAIPDFTDLDDSRVSINDNGRIVIASRSKYSDLSLLVYNEDLQLLHKSTYVNRIETSGGLDVKLSNNGQIILAWTFFSKMAIQRFDEIGTKIGDETVFTGVDALRHPRLGVNDNGDYCVIFKSSSSGSGLYFIQKFKRDGEKDGDIIQVNTYISHYRPEVSYNNSKQIFASWGSSAYTRKGSDILVKGFMHKLSNPSRPIIYHQKANLILGDSIAFGGNFIKSGGKFSHTYNSGMDSTVLLTVNVIVKNPPPTPEGLSIGEGDRFVQLKWKNINYYYFNQYLIYRSKTPDKNTATLINRTNSTMYLDQEVSYSQTYYYWVVSEDVSGKQSEFSQVADGSPVNNPPAKPRYLSAKFDEGTIHLSWEANSEPDVQGYYIYRNTMNDSSSAVLIGNSNSTYFEDTTGLVNGPRYYWLKAVDEEGQLSQFNDFFGFVLVDSLPEENNLPEETSPAFKFFPNPSIDAVTITFNNPNNISEIIVVDAMGKNFNVNWNQSGNESFVMVNSLPPGIYYLWIVTISEKFGVKMIKK